MGGAREWCCGCGYALLLQPARHGPALVFDGENRVTLCPRCGRDLAAVDGRALELGAAIRLLDRARTGEQLERNERDDLARALGLEPPVLDELLTDLQGRRPMTTTNVLTSGRLPAARG